MWSWLLKKNSNFELWIRGDNEFTVRGTALISSTVLLTLVVGLDLIDIVNLIWKGRLCWGAKKVIGLMMRTSSTNNVIEKTSAVSLLPLWLAGPQWKEIINVMLFYIGTSLGYLALPGMIQMMF